MTRRDYLNAKRTEKDQINRQKKEKDNERKTIDQIAALRKKAKEPTRSPLQMLASCSEELLETHRKRASVVLNESESDGSCADEVSYFESVFDNYRALRGKFPKKSRIYEEPWQSVEFPTSFARLEIICEDDEEECDNQDQNLEREECLHDIRDDAEDESFSGTSLRLVEEKAMLNSSSIEHEEADVLREDDQALSSIEHEVEDEQFNRSIAESIGSFKDRMKQRRSARPF